MLSRTRSRFHFRGVAAAALALACLAGRAGATTLVDPIGDSTSHDIASATGTYGGTRWTLGATFAPGTLDLGDFGFAFGLDVDEDPTTGVPDVGPGGEDFVFPIGGEIYVFYHVDHDPTHARVYLWVPALGENRLAATVPVLFGADSLQLKVPLSLSADLGGGMSYMVSDDGLALFGLTVGDLNDSGGFTVRDFVPDGADDGPLGGPTSFVPEPALGALVTGGLLAAAARRRRG
jgi:hypothetical protein